MMTHFCGILILSPSLSGKKTLSELDPLWQKFLDPRTDIILVFKVTSELNMSNLRPFGWRHLNNTSVSNVRNYIIL